MAKKSIEHLEHHERLNMLHAFPWMKTLSHNMKMILESPHDSILKKDFHKILHIHNTILAIKNELATIYEKIQAAEEYKEKLEEQQEKEATEGKRLEGEVDILGKSDRTDLEDIESKTKELDKELEIFNAYLKELFTLQVKMIEDYTSDLREIFDTDDAKELFKTENREALIKELVNDFFVDDDEDEDEDEDLDDEENTYYDEEDYYSDDDLVDHRDHKRETPPERVPAEVIPEAVSEMEIELSAEEEERFEQLKQIYDSRRRRKHGDKEQKRHDRFTRSLSIRLSPEQHALLNIARREAKSSKTARAIDEGTKITEDTTATEEVREGIKLTRTLMRITNTVLAVARFRRSTHKKNKRKLTGVFADKLPRPVDTSTERGVNKSNDTLIHTQDAGKRISALLAIHKAAAARAVASKASEEAEESSLQGTQSKPPEDSSH